MKTDKDRKIYSVSEVNYFARQTLEQMEVWVEGEISTLKQNPNWRFYYLDLKDESAILPCVAEGSVFDDFTTDELIGQKVIVCGFLTLYEPRGQYQLKILKIEAVGQGVLQKKLEELVKKLKSEGLFDLEHKKEIPLYPKKICVVTSKGSDAWHDFKRHTSDKFPLIKLTTADIRVQGPQSIPQLLKVLPKVDQLKFDVIVITRGGGSLEDLEAFNDEQVARVIFNMKTPTIVAIGHEANESLAEWVADRHASTPTDAASIITQAYIQILQKLEGLTFRLQTASDHFFSRNFQKLDFNLRQIMIMKSYYKDLPHRLNTLKESLKHHQRYLLSETAEKINESGKMLIKSSKLLLENNSLKLIHIGKSLKILSPENTLERGYAIVRNVQGKVVNNIQSVALGERLGVTLVNGTLITRILEKREK